MIRLLHRWVVRRKFQKLIQDFDNQIAEARAKHLPTRHIIQAKREYVHQMLGRTA
jgi:hypothetical protein